MNNIQAAITDENKKYIEGLAHKIGRELGLEGLSIEWEDPPDKTMGAYNLRVNVPEHNPVDIPFSARDLRWKTYYPEEGEDVARFLEDEKKSQRFESYDRRQKWDAQIRQALSGFGTNPIGFIS